MAADVARAMLQLLLFNLPFLVLGYFYFIERPALNLDVLLGTLLAIWSRRAAAVWLLLAWALDACVSQALTFHFASPLEFLRSFRFGSELHVPDFLAPATFGLVLPFLVCFVALRRQFARRLRRIAVVGVAIVALLIDLLNGSSFLAPGTSRLFAMNVVGSATGTIAVQIARARDFGNPRAFESPGPKDQHQAVVDWMRAHPQGSILYVIVESLGWHESEQVRAWLTQRLTGGDLAGRYEIEVASTPFIGSTTAGELRSLCALSGSYSKLSPPQVTSCLPYVAKELGWQTHAVHGFTGRMFDRKTWWPSIGIDDVWFAERLLSHRERRCGAAFRGACDDDAIRIGAAMAEPPGNFAYVLTLNTHLPMLEVTPSEDLRALCRESRLTTDSCGLIQALGDVLGNVQAAAMRTSGRIAVVVVGDHAPPFGRIDERRRFSEHIVPYYFLRPKGVSASR